RILFVDDSHAVGVIGATGRGTPEQLGVHGKVEVLSGTLGKALGGAAGGYIAGNKDLIAYLRQKSRPYTFSNSLPPSIAVAAIEAFTILEQDPSLIERLRQNTAYFRKHIQELGYKILADRKSTRLNSSHVAISYAVFCLKKKNKIHRDGYSTQDVV